MKSAERYNGIYGNYIFLLLLAVSMLSSCVFKPDRDDSTSSSTVRMASAQPSSIFGDSGEGPKEPPIGQSPGENPVVNQPPDAELQHLYIPLIRRDKELSERLKEALLAMGLHVNSYADIRQVEGHDDLYDLVILLEALHEGYESAQSVLLSHGDSFTSRSTGVSFENGPICSTLLSPTFRTIVIPDQRPSYCETAEVYHLWQMYIDLFQNGNSLYVSEALSNVFSIWATELLRSLNDPLVEVQPAEDAAQFQVFIQQIAAQYLHLGDQLPDGTFVEHSAQFTPEMPFIMAIDSNISGAGQYQEYVEQMATVPTQLFLDALLQSDDPIRDMYLLAKYVKLGATVPHWLRDEYPYLADAIELAIEINVLASPATFTEQVVALQNHPVSSSLVRRVSDRELIIQTVSGRIDPGMAFATGTVVPQPYGLNVKVDVRNYIGVDGQHLPFATVMYVPWGSPESIGYTITVADSIVVNHAGIQYNIPTTGLPHIIDVQPSSATGTISYYLGPLQSKSLDTNFIEQPLNVAEAAVVEK